PDRPPAAVASKTPETTHTSPDPDDDEDLPPLRPVVLEDWDEADDLFGNDEFEEDPDE
ncbi:MAG: hypothetical protein GY798_31140, partial [Hyphomicrobiales bacterium]|nr:hypothetical protein [Hyphomicrobiales bacterium]